MWAKVRDTKPSSFIKFPCDNLANLIDNMTCNDVEQRYSIDDVLNNEYLKRYSNQIYIPSNNKVSKIILIILGLNEML